LGGLHDTIAVGRIALMARYIAAEFERRTSVVVTRTALVAG